MASVASLRDVSPEGMRLRRRRSRGVRGGTPGRVAARRSRCVGWVTRRVALQPRGTSGGGATKERLRAKRANRTNPQGYPQAVECITMRHSEYPQAGDNLTHTTSGTTSDALRAGHSRNSRLPGCGGGDSGGASWIAARGWVCLICARGWLYALGVARRGVGWRYLGGSQNGSCPCWCFVAR